MGEKVKAVVENGMVHVLDETGTPKKVPRDQLGQALANGFQLRSAAEVKSQRLQEKHGGIGEQAITLAEGAASGATFGLSDVALDAAGADTAGRAVANPTTRGAGEVLGVVAPVVLSGGTGSAAALARLTPAAKIAAGAAKAEGLVARGVRGVMGTGKLATVTERAAALATSGAIEGAAFGAGRAVSDAALGDTPLTAEKLLSAAEHGAMWGGATGGVLGVSGVALKAAARRASESMLGGKTLQEAATDFANKRAIKGVTGRNRKVFAELHANPERAKRIGERLRQMNLSGDAATDAVALHTARKAVGKEMGTLASELDGMGVSATGPLKNAVAAVKQQAELARADFGLGAGKKVAKKLEKQIEKIDEELQGGREFTFSEAWKMRQAIDSAETAALEKVAQGRSSPVADAIAEMRRSFDDAVTAAIPQADDALVAAAAQGSPAAVAQLSKHNSLRDAWKALKTEYSDLAMVAKAADDNSIREAANRWGSPTDYASGLGSGNLIGVLTGLATGSVGVGALAGLAGGAVAGIAHKYARERGSAFVAKMAERVAAFDTRVEAAAKALVREGGVGKAAKTAPAIIAAGNWEDRFDTLRQQLGVFQHNPEKAVEMLAEMTGDIAIKDPTLAQELHTQILGDSQYLLSKMPLAFSRVNNSLTPMLEEGRISGFDKRRAVRIADALNDPASVLEDLQRGVINRDGIQALQDRRPQVFEIIQGKVIEEVAMRDTPLPFRKRTLLSVAFDFQGDWSLLPQNLAAIQAAVRPQEEAQPSGGGGANMNIDPGRMMQPTGPQVGEEL